VPEPGATRQRSPGPPHVAEACALTGQHHRKESRCPAGQRHRFSILLAVTIRHTRTVTGGPDRPGQRHRRPTYDHHPDHEPGRPAGPDAHELTARLATHRVALVTAAGCPARRRASRQDRIAASDVPRPGHAGRRAYLERAQRCQRARPARPATPAAAAPDRRWRPGFADRWPGAWRGRRAAVATAGNSCAPIRVRKRP